MEDSISRIRRHGWKDIGRELADFLEAYQTGLEADYEVDRFSERFADYLDKTCGIGDTPCSQCRQPGGCSCGT